MLYQIAAELILTLHLLVVVIVVAGGLLVLWRPRFAWLHLLLVVWCSVVNLMSWTCPLTPAENELRRAAGDVGYDRTFIEHYIAPVVYPGGMTRELELVAGISLPIWNALLYGWAWRRHRKRDAGSGDADTMRVGG